ncbi:MAG: tyrosine-type recombinase/integrase, partial [Candidatus Phlomobacter fragariae]
ILNIKYLIFNIKLSETLGFKKTNSEYIITDEGKKISTNKISKGFAKFRYKSKLTWEGNPPSFHEIRSLSARLYTEKMGGDFAQKLLGHKSAEMTAKYQDNRSNDWIEL